LLIGGTGSLTGGTGWLTGAGLLIGGMGSLTGGTGWLTGGTGSLTGGTGWLTGAGLVIGGTGSLIGGTGWVTGGTGWLTGGTGSLTGGTGWLTGGIGSLTGGTGAEIGGAETGGESTGSSTGVTTGEAAGVIVLSPGIGRGNGTIGFLIRVEVELEGVPCEPELEAARPATTEELTEDDETEEETTERLRLSPVLESVREEEAVPFTTGAMAKTVFVTDARTRVVGDRIGVSTASARILEELRRHKSRLLPLLAEESCMIAVLEVSSLCGGVEESDGEPLCFYSRGGHVVFCVCI